MGLWNRLRGRQEEATAEAQCPRCGENVPVNAVTCTACGWDTRDKYDAGMNATPAPSRVS